MVGNTKERPEAVVHAPAEFCWCTIHQKIPTLDFCAEFIGVVYYLVKPRKEGCFNGKVKKKSFKH